MARVRVTVYKNSILASICSIIGTIFVIIGLVTLIQGEEEKPVCIFLMILGVLFALLGDFISENKRFKQLRKELRSQNMEAQIAVSTELSFQVYNLMPGKKMLKYINSLNPQAAALIQEDIAGKRQKKNRRN